MDTQRFFLPNPGTLKSDNRFEWKINDVSSAADGTIFEYYYNEIFDKKTWEFYGWLGNTDEGTYRAFVFSVPYINDETFSKTYTLSDELQASYMYTRKLPNGVELIVVRPQGAQLIINKLDPKTGTVEASFSAMYHDSGKLLHAQGDFYLTRDDQ